MAWWYWHERGVVRYRGGISFIGYTPIHAGAVSTDPVMGDCVEGNYSARITQPRMVKMLVLKTGLFYIIELMRKRSFSCTNPLYAMILPGSAA